MKNNSDIVLQLTRFVLMKLNRTLIIIFAIVGLVPPLFFRFMAVYNGKPFGTFSEVVINLTISVVMTVTISSGVVTVMIWLHKKFPWREGIFKRLFLEIFLTLLTACTLVTIFNVILYFVGLNKTLLPSIFTGLIIAMILNFVLVAITEGIFFFQQWKQSAVEAEQFKKESIKAQFETLKNQVNPHFLFNSLNTLSGLIDMDKEVSKGFVDNLSQVYRYVLQNKDEELVTLKTEYNFIQAFIQLLKKRHGDRIAFEFDIQKEDLNQNIPPMSLQLLVENAVKHNIASRKKPLKIKISSNGKNLIVQNNLQKKKVLNSTGIGLQNIRNRYKFLTDEEIEVVENENIFKVKIPLIEII